MADSFKADSFVADGTKPTPEPKGVYGNALADTFGFSDRPGRVGLTSNAPGKKTPLGVVLNPQNMGEVATREAIMAPVTYGSGAGFGRLATRLLPAASSAAKAAPAIGRVAATGATGAATASAQGRDVPTSTLLDVVLGAGAEGLGAGVAWAAGKKAAPLLKERAEAVATNEGRAKAFDWATKSVDEAWDAIKSRMPNAKVVVPSLSSAKMKLEDAVQQLKTLTGPKFQQALAELKWWMDRLDKQRLAGGPGPRAGREFGRRAATERYVAPQVPMPTGTTFQRVAEGAMKGAKSAELQSIADSLAIAPVPAVGGIQAGVLGAAMVPGSKRLARHVPGGAIVADALEEVE